MMIDDQEQVQILMERMQATLPIPATMTSRLLRGLRDQGKSFGKRDVLIHSIMYSGDEGGIMCGITAPSPKAKEVVLVSLTHLRVSLRHPLGADIRAYQQVRIDKLARYHGVVSSTITRRLDDD
jgi:hypothetical protein